MGVFEWVDPPQGIQAIPSRFLYRWKYNQDGKPCRQKSRVVVQGFHEADTGADKAATVASQESVHLLIDNAANNGLILRQVDVKTAFLQARMERDDPDVYVIPSKGFECEEKQKDQVWRLKAWLYGLRLSRGWWGTMHTLLEIGFVSSTADPCVYNLDYGAVLLLLYVDDILLSGSDDEKVLQVVEKLKDRFETVDLGDAKFVLGMGIHRNVHAGTIILSQEKYARTILETYRMADARPTKTPAEAGPVKIEEDEIL